MSETATKLLEQLLALPEAERLQIAERLYQSLDAESLLPDDPEFYDELARRSDEAHAHPERLLSGDQVFENLREHLRRKRGQ